MNQYDDHVDYKTLYLRMVRATEKAMRILIESQKQCEEIVMGSTHQFVDDIYAAYKDSGEEPELDGAFIDVIEEDYSYDELGPDDLPRL